MQATSCTLFEEVKFDRKTVQSVDWASYPKGAGEPVTRVVPAAIGNAFFDETGICLRKVPLTPARAKAALAAA
jgi:CO/xanthine dehydrogenase Mo-binding subunit